MQKTFVVGTQEKHKITFHVNWFLGYCHLGIDGKTLFRRPFFLKVDRTFEVGTTERHLVHFEFNVFDYFRDVLRIRVDGRDITKIIAREEQHYHLETPVDDAAAALLYIAAVNLVFSVIGTLFVPYLQQAEVRILLLIGGLVYVLLARKILSGSVAAIAAAMVFFTVDSLLNLVLEFSTGGLIIRLIILYYLAVGLRYARITSSFAS